MISDSVNSAWAKSAGLNPLGWQPASRQGTGIAHPRGTGRDRWPLSQLWYLYLPLLRVGVRALLGPDGHQSWDGGKCPSEGLGKRSDASSWAGTISAVFACTNLESKWVGGCRE